MHDIHKWRAFVRSPLDNATNALALPYGGTQTFAEGLFFFCFPASFASSAIKKGRGGRCKKKRGDRFSPSPRFR